MTRDLQTLGPRDHSEEVALFRAQVLGPLLARPLARGELVDGLRALSRQRFTPPGSLVSRCFAVSTLEQWLYAYRRYGLEGLVPTRRSDRGAARDLTQAQRDLICAIRREHPRASAELIIRTLEQDGRVETGKVSPSTVRRLFLEHGLDKPSLLQSSDGAARLRWEAAEVDALWHADVCHGPTLQVEGRKVPLRIHALLDDKSRHVVAIQAAATEREQEMLALVVNALRRWHPPKTLYLDNGSTYSGRTLLTACGRLGISLVHAKPYDPQARGKMERFWRTLREGCLDHISVSSSLHDVQVRMLAFLDTHYHVRGHGSLMGKSPGEVYEAARRREPSPITEARLKDALTVHGKRRVKRDGTLEVGGVLFETRAGFLAGRIVVVGRSLLDPSSDPWIEHEGQRFQLEHVDPVRNGRRSRHARKDHRSRAGLDLDFDPPGAALASWLGQTGRHAGGAQ